FDQGQQGMVIARRGRAAKGGVDAPPSIKIDSGEELYMRYELAIASKGTRQRVTGKVYPELTPDGSRMILNDAGWHGPSWLVGKEIMWTDGNGGPVAPGSLLNPVAPGNNQNPPTITCIAANQYVKDAASNPIVSGVSTDLKNEMSLAFLVKFNNFK